MLGAHLGNLCLLGSHRGVIVGEYEDAVILFKEFIRLLEYHARHFSGGWGRKKDLYNLPLQFLIERCVGLSIGRGENHSLVFVNKPITSLSTANLSSLREQCFLELMQLCWFEKYVTSHSSFPTAFCFVSLLLYFNVS